MNVNRFFNPNYFPMKRSVMNAGLFALVFVFGGMFLAIESQAQTTTAQYHATAPSGSSWVSNAQANLTVSQQISLLTNNINNLVAANADNQSILLAKRELLMWVYIQQHLAAGMPVGSALELAHQKISAGRGALVNSDPTVQGKLDEWYNSAISKLTT
jgi:hypothetical protein